MKLTLGQAANTAKRSKGTLSKALNSGGISAEKDGKGRWQIDPSELSRWMSANPFPNSRENQFETPEETHENSALLVKAEAMRHQIAAAELERTREREQLTDRIESLQQMLADERAERRQLTALLTDQREKAVNLRRRGFWGWMKS
jgi:hypothetical protein